MKKGRTSEMIGIMLNKNNLSNIFGSIGTINTTSFFINGIIMQTIIKRTPYELGNFFVILVILKFVLMPLFSRKSS